MTKLQPAPTHYTVRNLGISHQFIISSRKIWYVMATTGFGVLIWTIGCITLAIFLPGLFNSMLNATDGQEIGVFHVAIAVVLLASLVFWIFLGVFIVRIFLWHIGGKEIIEITPQSIKLRRQIFNLGRTKVYPLKHVKNLRFAPPAQAPDLPDIAVDPYGISLTIDWLAFEYDKKTIWFARSLNETEARHLLKAIQQHLVQGAS
ncbi:MAG: hypothetical protein JW953_09205 [Anaerolineae bacterium]|nr:hypothetical protein [Anaerolineae bacterium]